MISFAAAVVVGMIVRNDAFTIIWRATLIMIACWFVGRIIGGVVMRSINENLDAYRQAHPLPSDEDDHVSDVDADVQDSGDGAAVTTTPTNA